MGRTERGRIGREAGARLLDGRRHGPRGAGALRAGGIATYDAPAAAAAAVGHLTDWGRAQAALLHVPDRRSEEMVATAPGARERVAALLRAAAAEGRRRLTPAEAGAALAAYGIPVAQSRIARDAAQARRVASEMLADGSRLAVKVLSPDLPHRSDVGGVVLDVATAAEVEAAVAGIAERVARDAAGARIDGYELQPMVVRPEAVESSSGSRPIRSSGRSILFGAGGLAVEILRDTAVALPPLDSGLAAELVARTRVSAQLAGYRGRPPADLASLNGALIALSHLVEDFPCLRAVDVNPLLSDAQGVVALDMNVEFDPAELDLEPPNPHLVIRPYPAEWRRTLERPDGKYELRPIRPADALLYPDFLARVEPGGPAAALPVGARALSRGVRPALDPARLRPGDGVRGAHSRGRVGGGEPGGGGARASLGRILAPRALGPAGAGHRRGADADPDRLRPGGRAGVDRGHGVGGEPADAGAGRGPGVRRSPRTRTTPGWWRRRCRCERRLRKSSPERGAARGEGGAGKTQCIDIAGNVLRQVTPRLLVAVERPSPSVPAIMPEALADAPDAEPHEHDHRHGQERLQ